MYGDPSPTAAGSIDHWNNRYWDSARVTNVTYAATITLQPSGWTDSNYIPIRQPYLSPRGRRIAEEIERWAAILQMSASEYLEWIARRPPLPKLPRPPHRTELHLHDRLAPRMDHRVHRMRVRDPGRWLAGAGRRASGRRREPVDA